LGNLCTKRPNFQNLAGALSRREGHKTLFLKKAGTLWPRANIDDDWPGLSRRTHFHSFTLTHSRE
jgi:hypothetical protein